MLIFGYLAEDLEKYFVSKAQAESAVVTDEDKDRVLLYIMKRGSCYPKEVGDALTLDVGFTYKVFTALEHDGYLVRININRYYPQPIIKHRIVDMWGRGVRGYEGFTKMSWYCLSQEGIFYLKNKYLGQHKQAHKGYLKLYPNIKLNSEVDDVKD